MDGFQSLRGKLCCFYPTGQAWVDIAWALILHIQYGAYVYVCDQNWLLFASGVCSFTAKYSKI